MAKKHPIYRLHKVIIHPNRWLAWAIAYSVIVTIAVVGYIKVSDVNFENQVADSKFVPWHSYKDSRLGFSVRYPADWSIEADNKSTINFVPSSNSDQGVEVQVTTTASLKSIRKTLRVLRETTISLDGKPAQKISNDLGKGHSETVILSMQGTKLYVMRGTDTLVEELLLTFHFESGSENLIKK